MEKIEEEILVELVERDPQIKKLYTQHQKLEREIASVSQYAVFSPAAKLRAQELKKEKLRGRDELMSILRRYDQDKPITQ